MKPSCLRLTLSLALLLLLPRAARPDDPPDVLWGPVKEYVYAGSRLLVIGRPHGVADPPFLTNPPTPIVVSEGAGRVSVPVTLTNPGDKATTVEVRVSYATKPGTAREESDFKPTSGVLVFPAQSGKASTTLEIEVPILDDDTGEPEKAFTVVLSDPKGAEILSPTSRTVVITDDDPMPSAPGGEKR